MHSFTNFGFHFNFLLSKLWKLILITFLNPSQSRVKFCSNSNYIELLFNMLTFFTLYQSKIESNPIQVIDCVSISQWYLPLTKRIHWIFVILHLNMPNFRVLFFLNEKKLVFSLLKQNSLVLWVWWQGINLLQIFSRNLNWKYEQYRH